MPDNPENHSDARLVNYREREGKPEWGGFEPLCDEEIAEIETGARDFREMKGPRAVLGLIATIRAKEGEVARLRALVGAFNTAFQNSEPVPEGTGYVFWNADLVVVLDAAQVYESAQPKEEPQG